jgi:hypothetical protein
VDIPKDKIQFWLESFRAGDVTDKKYQAKLIDSFVQAIYLYDGEMRAAFNYCGKKNSVTVSLDEVDGLGGDASAESSYKIPSPPPQKAVKLLISRLFCNFYKELLGSRTIHFLAVFGNNPRMVPLVWPRMPDSVLVPTPLVRA